MNSVYFRLVYDRVNLISEIYLLRSWSPGLMTWYRLSLDTGYNPDYPLEDWLSDNVFYWVPFNISGKKLIAYFRGPENDLLVKVRADFESDKFIRFNFFSHDGKKLKKVEFRYLCSSVQFENFSSITSFVDYLVENVPEVSEQIEHFRRYLIPEPDSVDLHDFIELYDDLDYVLNYDPAKDPKENPWIDVFGDGDEAEQAYWNTQ